MDREKDKVIYAGLIWRGLSEWIDIIIVTSSSLFLIFLIRTLPIVHISDKNVLLLTILISFICCPMYFVALESSAWQATIGKRLTGLIVTDLKGHRLSVKHAIGRLFSIIIVFSLAIGTFSFITIIFTKKKQAIHDIIASTQVIRSPEYPRKERTIKRTAIAIILLSTTAILTMIIIIPNKIMISPDNASQNKDTENVKQEVPRVQPINAEDYLERGNTYYSKGDFDSAISNFTKAIEINPKLAEAYINRGVAYYGKGNYDQAISDYNRAIELNPKLDVDVNPKIAEAYNNRGNSYLKKGDHKRAMTDYQKAAELGNTHAQKYLREKDAGVFNNRGHDDAEKKSYTKAISNFTKAIELNPEFALAYYNRGISYFNLGWKDKAINDFKKAARLGDTNAQKYLSENEGTSNDIPETKNDSTVSNTIFTDNGDGTMTDTTTGLMWTKNANLAGRGLTLQDTLKFVASMNYGSGTYGYKDWRLPIKNEIWSLINNAPYDKYKWLNINGYIDVQPGWYWSSSTWVYTANDQYYYSRYSNSTSGTTGGVWKVSALNGSAEMDAMISNNYVWPVRGGH
ncbi:MAG: tetratricopeptide repeat protein [Nitrospirae bacterium]|nr:tetratricopeptide repeat protein [Nitrospirota bacterium]